MVIQDIIGGIVREMVVEGGTIAPTFIHGEQTWVNLKADEIINDLVILDEPLISDDSYKQSGLYEENYRLKIFFFTKLEFDDTPEEHKPLIVKMRKARKNFINKLSRRADIRRFDGLRTVDIKNVFNANLIGVMLSISITPKETSSRC